MAFRQKFLSIFLAASILTSGSVDAAPKIAGGTQQAARIAPPKNTVIEAPGLFFIILCSSGYAFSFNGTLEGAHEVAGLICGSAAAAKPIPRTKINEALVAVDVEKYLKGKGTDLNTALARKREDPTYEVPAMASYPPHGYPCLGCHPCPPDYCDNDNTSVVGSNVPTVFDAKRKDRETVKKQQ